MKKKDLTIDFEWQKWESDGTDLKEVKPHVATRILFDIFLINEFENSLLKLDNEGYVWGPVHVSVGQEAIAAATIAALCKSDKISGTHRAHHQFIAKWMHYILPESWNPARDILPEVGLEVIKQTLAEIIGLASGCCGGHGGSMHLRSAEAGFIGSNAVVGGGIPLATGAAFAEKYKNTGNIVVCFFGDGANNQGVFHEACNLAGIWNLPIIYFIENNFYAECTPIENVCAVKDLSARAVSYGMNAYIVDGNDPLAIYESVKKSADNIRRGGKGCIIEAKTYRHYDHIGNKLGSTVGYRSKQEEVEWLQKDAISQFPKKLIRAGILTKEVVDRIKNMARTSVCKAIEFCMTSGKPRVIHRELWPKPETVCDGLRSDGCEWHDVQFSEIEGYSKFRNILYREAIAEVITHWFEKVKNVFLIGEGVGEAGSLLYKTNKKLLANYADRLFNTPLSEAGFVGLSCGAAMLDMRPIVEIMYSKFCLVAADQLFNQIGVLRYIYGNTTDLPIVLRTKVSIGFGYGDQHAMNPVMLFTMFPGWHIVVPSNAFDYIGLFNSAMQSLDPVLIVEYASLYDNDFKIPKENLNYFIPFGKAKVVKSGKDVTIITYGAMTRRCEKLCSQLACEGISIEIIDLRTVDLLDIDYNTINKSLHKTGLAVIVEEAANSQSICRIIANNIMERFSNILCEPIVCITCKDVNPVSRVLESLCTISDQEILETIMAVVKRSKRASGMRKLSENKPR